MNLPIDMTLMSSQERLEKMSELPKIEPLEEEEEEESKSSVETKIKFNISELLEADRKPNTQSSPSASSEDSTTDVDPSAFNFHFDPKIIAAFLQQSFMNASSPNQLLPFSVFPMLAFPPAAQLMNLKHLNQADFVLGTQQENGEEKEVKTERKEGETRDSTGGSPVESDADEDDEMVRGSDDEANSSDPLQARKKKTRTVFSRNQVSQLEMTFECKRYLSSQERSQLAQKLHLTETQVKIWFQNRRNKFKRQAQSDDATTSLQMHRANIFSIQQNSNLSTPVIPIPTTTAGMSIRGMIPSPLDPTSAAARFLFGYTQMQQQQGQSICSTAQNM